MKIRIHRGAREVGGSCLEIAEGNARIVIDMGLPLRGVGEEEPDPAACLPRIEGLYRGGKPGDRVKALFLSHSHPDHFGLAGFADGAVPVHLGRATKELLELSSAMGKKPVKIENARFIEDGKPVSQGPFTVTPILVDHSAMDAYAFLVEAGGKRLFYSGDLRSHGRKGRLVEEIMKGEKVPPPIRKGRAGEGSGIDALVLEGTNISLTARAKSELEVEGRLASFLKEKKRGMTLLLTSSQNLDRLVSIYKACRSAGKTLVVDPYAAFVLEAMSKYGRFPHPSRSFRELRVFFASRITRKMFRLGHREKVVSFSPFKIEKPEIVRRRDEIVMLVKSSMRENLEKDMECFEGGSLVWSMWEGYMRENSNLDFLHFLAGKIGKNGTDPESGDPLLIEVIHTSGHADPETLRRFVRALGPKTVIPIHTANPERYRELFPDVTVLRDGEEFEV